MTAVTVNEFFGLKKNPKGSVGIEIEVEGARLPADDLLLPYWTATHDGSLRANPECREYVLKSPMPLKGARIALDHMQKTFTDNETVINTTVRAGVHVHLNVNNLTLGQLFAFVGAYYIFEELLTRWCGPGRQGNQFALRAMDAYDVVSHINSFFQTQRHAYLSSDEIRYAACNFCALRKYGSIEFRQLGTSPDLNRVYRWTAVLHTLLENSVALFNHPVQVVTDFSGHSYDDFINRLLPPDMADEFVFSHNDYTESMRRGVRIVQDWAFECPPDTAWKAAATKIDSSTLQGRIQWVPTPPSRLSERLRASQVPFPEAILEDDINDN